MRGFKCFLSPSGVDVSALSCGILSCFKTAKRTYWYNPTDPPSVRRFVVLLSHAQEFPHIEEADLEKAMAELQDTGSLLMFHAERDLPSTSSPAGDPQLYSTFLHSRPSSAEESAISLIISLSRRFPALRTHIVHLSASSALPLVRAARAEGLNLTAETCFHYLALEAENIPQGRCDFKCCPPIRDVANRELLWSALLSEGRSPLAATPKLASQENAEQDAGSDAGGIDYVVSDHSPCVIELKCMEEGDFLKAWGGVGGLGLGLSLLWTEAKRRGVPLGRVIEWTGAYARAACVCPESGREYVDADNSPLRCAQRRDRPNRRDWKAKKAN